MLASESESDVAVFWDYENCHAASHISGYEIANGIRNVAHRFGSVKSFKAYMEMPDPRLETLRSLSLRSELQSSGVSLIDCPHNGRKNVADQMIMVDMLTYAMDHPSPATFILISGDRDFAYVVSVLRLRRYRVVVISLTLPGAHISLKVQASVCLDWNVDVMGLRPGAEPASVIQPPISAAVQSPVSQRATYFGEREVPFSFPKTEQPAVKPVSAPIPSFATTSPREEPPLEQSSLPSPLPPPPIRPSVVCAPAPTYTANIPQHPSITESYAAGSSRSPNGISMPRPKSTPASYYSFTEDPTAQDAALSDNVISAHILRCMLGDKAASPPGPSVHAENPSPVPPLVKEVPPAVPGPSVHAMKAATVAGPTPRVEQTSPQPHIPLKMLPASLELLVDVLREHWAKGATKPLRSTIAINLTAKDKSVYKKAGVLKFSQYTALAEQAKVILVGGAQATAWISLHPDFQPSGK